MSRSDIHSNRYPLTHDAQVTIRNALDEKRKFMIRQVVDDLPAIDILRSLAKPEHQEMLLGAARLMPPTSTETDAHITVGPGLVAQVNIDIQEAPGSAYPTMLIPVGEYRARLKDSPLHRAVRPVMQLVQDWVNLQAAVEFLFTWDKVYSGEQYNFFLPWLPDLIAGSWGDPSQKGPYHFRAQGSRTMATLRAIYSRKVALNTPAMPRHLLDVCRSGSRLLAQHNLLNDARANKGYRPAAGYARLTIEPKSVKPTVSFDELKELPSLRAVSRDL